MGDYEHCITVRRDADSRFEFLAAVENLPEYIESMESAEPVGNGEARVAAMIAGQRREGTAWLRTDASRRAMQWGSEGSNGYHGELRVEDGPDGSPTATVLLHTERADGPGIRAGLEQTLANIKTLVEGRSTELTR